MSDLTNAVGGARTIVYTDGACQGNPGPGGWAWAVPGGRWRAGAERRTTNQRMEISAVLDAVRTMDGPLEVVSDSTYVVNCFKQGWWKKWVVNGWVNSTRQPVANRDLWEPLIDLYRGGPDRLHFRWVKGHGKDPYNDLVDRLAVAAATTQEPAQGDAPPPAGSLGVADRVGRERCVVAREAPPGGRGPEMARRALGALEQHRVDGPAGTQVRSAKADDAAGVVSFWRSAGARAGHTDDVQSVRALLAYDPEALVLAEAAGDLVGTVVAGFDGWRAHLYRLVVHPDWRRKGVGSALVAESERRLLARGVKRVGGLVVTADAPTVKFWLARGYEPNQFALRYGKTLSY